MLEEARQPFSIIGWSLGGIYAREVARQLPDHVRQVISLGSPLEMVRGDDSDDPTAVGKARPTVRRQRRTHRSGIAPSAVAGPDERRLHPHRWNRAVAVLPDGSRTDE